MACGLPIIAAPTSNTVVTASNEVIDDDNNFFTKTHSVVAFANTYDLVAQLSPDAYHNISKFNRKQAELRFSWAALAKHLLSESNLSDKESEKR
jgi:glycosyltransferase involved in cell wall biosynthesis